MNIIINAYNKLLHGMAGLAGIAIFAAFVMIVVDVLMRITGLEPFIFILTTVEYILLWFTMLAAPWLVRIKGHVFIDAVTQFLPDIVKKIIAKIVYAICTVAASIYCVHAAGLVINAWTGDMVDVRSVDMPLWTLYAPMPIGLLFVALEFARYLIGIDDMYSKAIDERESV